MPTVIISAHGKTESNLIDAIEEARQSIEKGNLGGVGSNEFGGYSFAIDGFVATTPSSVGAPKAQIESVQVVNVEGRTDGNYVFADLDDAMAFEATINADADRDGYRTEEVICDHTDALKLIAAECEASEEAEAASLESGIPVATYAWRKGEDAPYPDKLECVEYTVYLPDSDEMGESPRTIFLWVGLRPDNGSVNVDAGRQRLEAEGWEVTDWTAA